MTNNRRSTTNHSISRAVRAHVVDARVLGPAPLRTTNDFPDAQTIHSLDRLFLKGDPEEEQVDGSRAESF
jgi:hypothetical protein